MRLIICLGFTILLASCTTTTTNYYPHTVQSWRGGNIYALVHKWGPPDRVVTTPNGNTLYVYHTQSYRNLSTPSAPSVGYSMNRSTGHAVLTSPNINTTWNRGSMSVTCAAAFETANNGTILNTDIQGNGCYGNASFAERMSNPNVKS